MDSLLPSLLRPKHPFIRRLLLIPLFFTFIINVSAQKVKPAIIQGTADFACGEEIRLLAFDDMLTYHKSLAASDKIDKNGNFKLSCSVIEPTLVQIAIRTSKAEFYIEPEREYRLSIAMDTQLFELLDPMTYGGFLQIKCENGQQEDINYKINRYEHVSTDITDFFAPNILSDLTATQFDSISQNIQAQFPIEYAPDNFYKSYLYYSFASIERILLQKERQSLYNKYLNNEYILYNNPAYMNFFSEFYDHYLLSSPYIAIRELKDCINQNDHALTLFNLTGKDPLLVNERIRELVLLENLMQLYHNKDFNKNNILKIIQELERTTHFEEHRTIARDVEDELHRFSSGTTLPKAKMKEANGANFHLENFKGHWIYLQFFNTTCLDCIREMTIIKQLQQKYANRITFVSISIDFNFGHFIQFKEKYPQFDWQFVHFNGEYSWIDEMQITTLPDNMLIAPDGTLAQRYAPDITLELSTFLMQLFQEEEKLDTPLHPKN